MKNYFNQLSRLAMAYVLLLMTAACSEEELQPQQANEVPADVLKKFESLGFHGSEIEMTDSRELLNPQEESGNYLINDDMVITPEHLERLLQRSLQQGPQDEHYRTSNLVSCPRTITVVGYTGGSNALSSNMQTALSWAIANYNALNIGLSFSLSFSTSTSADIVVYRVSGSGGGSAGFPDASGNPYKWIQIQSGTDNYGTNVVEHVMTHEIGHAIGMRHTDYFDRSYSCGSGGNEGDGGVGAHHVPCTPTGYDPGSIFNACFSTSEDGEFGSYDVCALEYLYGC